MQDVVRCEWASDDLNKLYHDYEWGVPVHDDRKLFEFLILEGAQAGLSWTTILKKRENYRRALDNFDPQKIALYDEVKIQELLTNEGIIRNKLKVASAIKNAQAFLKVQKEFGSFDKYIWRFVNNKPIKTSLENLTDYPTQTKEAQAMSKDLLSRGFKFVGPTICYSFMQAMGLVDDHQKRCYRCDDL